MNYVVSRLYHCPCAFNYAKNVVLDMKITSSDLMIEMFQLLNEDLWYEHFSNNNVFLISCRERSVKVFVFDSCYCFHYYKRRHFVFSNTIACRTHPKGYKIIKSYTCYRRSIKKSKEAFLVFIILKHNEGSEIC